MRNALATDNTVDLAVRKNVNTCTLDSYFPREKSSLPGSAFGLHPSSSRKAGFECLRKRSVDGVWRGVSVALECLLRLSHHALCRAARANDGRVRKRQFKPLRRAHVVECLFPPFDQHIASSCTHLIGCTGSKLDDFALGPLSHGWDVLTDFRVLPGRMRCAWVGEAMAWE